MKKFKFYIISFLLLISFIELLSFFIVKIKKKDLEKNLITQNKFYPDILNNYSEYIPHLRDENTFYKLYNHISLDEINNFYTSINDFNNNNNANILFQGDSWAEGLNKKKTFYKLKDFSESNNIGIINGGITSFSPSAMTIQLDILSKEYNINPSIIVAIIDQSDIGDELFRYKSIDGSSFSKTLKKMNRNFQLKAINNFKKINFSSLKLIQYFYNYYNLHIEIYSSERVSSINIIYKKIKSKLFKIPKALYPLQYGVSQNEILIIKKRLNNYIDFAFKNEELKKIYIITHPHLKHLDQSSYKINIASIVDEVINDSLHFKNIDHINFKKINKEIDKEIYVKGDKFSHLTSDAYLNYFLPIILRKIIF